MLIRTKHLLMDKVTSTEGVSVSGYGTTQEDTTDVKTTEANGNSGATTESTTDAKGTSNTETKTDDKSKSDETTTREIGLSGYVDEVKVEEKTEVKTEEVKTEETKNDTKVEDLKIDLRGLTEDQTKDIIQFAKDLKLTPEQAQSVLDNRKEQLDKYNQQVADFDKQVKETHTKWEQDLRTEWSKDFGANVKAVNNTLTNHFPETAKMLATSGKRLNPMQMKEILNISKLLGDEGVFEAGGANSTTKERHPSDYYTN